MVDDLRVVAGRFFIRKGVEVSADRIHGLGDLARAAALGPLEEHVLDQMRDAALLGTLGGAADIGPDAEGSRAHVRHRLGNHANPVREGGLSVQRALQRRKGRT